MGNVARTGKRYGEEAGERQQKRSRTELIYFKVIANLVDTRKSQGFRKEVYALAQDSRAYYSLQGPDKSIFYEGESQDMTVSLFFESRADARDFQNRMVTMGIQHFGDDSRNRMQVTKVVEEILTSARTEAVFVDDYNSEDNKDSPPASLKNDDSPLMAAPADLCKLWSLKRTFCEFCNPIGTIVIWYQGKMRSMPMTQTTRFMGLGCFINILLG